MKNIWIPLKLVITGSNIFSDGWSLALTSLVLNSVSVLREGYVVVYVLRVV